MAKRLKDCYFCLNLVGPEGVQTVAENNGLLEVSQPMVSRYVPNRWQQTRALLARA